MRDPALIKAGASLSANKAIESSSAGKARFANSRRPRYVTKRSLPPLEQFTEVVIEQGGIRNQKEYQEARQKDPFFRKFPSEPYRAYPGFKWPGPGSSSDP